MPHSDNADVLAVAERWLEEGRRVALATVIETWSSAPLPAGSQMVVDADGAAAGSLAAGCIEPDVILAAADVIASGAAKLLRFGITDDVARAAGLACGGRMEIYVERLG